MPIYGTATLKGNSVNNGEIDNAVFTENSTNNGEVYSNATFTDSSSNSGIVDGDASFSGDAVNNGMVDGDASYSDTAVNLEEAISEDPDNLLTSTQKIDVEELSPTLGGEYDDDNVYPGGVDDSYAVPADSFDSYSDMVPFQAIPRPSLRDNALEDYLNSENLHHVATDALLNSKTYDVEEIRIHSDFIFRTQRENFGSYKNGQGKPFLVDVAGTGLTNLSRAIKIEGEVTPLPKRKDFYTVLASTKKQQIVVEGVSNGDYMTTGASRAECIDNSIVKYFNKLGKIIETRSRNGNTGSAAFRNNNPGNITFVQSWMGTRGVIGMSTWKDKKGKIRHDCIFASEAHGLAAIDYLLRTDSRYNKPGMTCTKMMQTYAPVGDGLNKPDQYAKFIMKHITTGVDISKRSYASLDAVTRGQVIRAITIQEGMIRGKVEKGPGLPDKVRIDIDPTKTKFHNIDAERIKPSAPSHVTPVRKTPPAPHVDVKQPLGYVPQSTIIDEALINTFFQAYTGLNTTPIYGIGLSEYNIAAGDLESSKVPEDGKYVISVTPFIETFEKRNGNWEAIYKYANYSVDIHNANFYNIVREAYHNGTSLTALNPDDEDLKSVYIASFKEIHNMITGPGQISQSHYVEIDGNLSVLGNAVGTTTYSKIEAYTDVNTCCFSLYGMTDLNILKRYMPSIQNYVIQPNHNLGITAVGGIYTQNTGTYTYLETVSYGSQGPFSFTDSGGDGSIIATNQYFAAIHGYYEFNQLDSNLAFLYSDVETRALSSIPAGNESIIATNSLLNNPSTVVGGADYVEAAALAYSKVKPHTWHRVCEVGSLISVAESTSTSTHPNYFGGEVYLFGLKYNGKSNPNHSVYGSLNIPSASRKYNIKDKNLLGAALDAQAVKMFWGTTDPAILASLKPCILIYCPNTGVKITVPVVDIRTDSGIGLTYGTLKKMFPTFNKNAANYSDSVQAIVVGTDEDTLLIRPAHIGVNLTHDEVRDHIRAKSYGINVPLVAKGDTAARRTFQQIRRTITSGLDNRITQYVSNAAKDTYNNKKLPSNISKVVTAVMYTATPAGRVAKIVQNGLTVIRYAPEVYINAAKFFTGLRNKDAKTGKKKIWIGYINKLIDYVTDTDEVHIVESIYNAAIKIVYKKHENWSLKTTVDAIRKRKANATEGSTITGVVGISH